MSWVLLWSIVLFSASLSVRSAHGARVRTAESVLVTDPGFHDARRDLYLAAVSTVFADDGGYVGGCYQMVSVRDSCPEEMVSVTCPRDGMAEVVHKVAAESVESRLREDGLQAALHVPVKTTRARISASDAGAVRQLWWRIMAEAVPGSIFGRVIESWEFYYFSVSQFGPAGLPEGIRSAMAKNPDVGTIPAQLVELGGLLAQYADAEPSERAGLLTRLRRVRVALERALVRPKPGRTHKIRRGRDRQP